MFFSTSVTIEWLLVRNDFTVQILVKCIFDNNSRLNLTTQMRLKTYLTVRPNSATKLANRWSITRVSGMSDYVNT